MNISIHEPSGRPVGAAPLFRHMAGTIDLVAIVHRMIPWDRRQCRVSPGERVLLLVLDLLSGKSPLYRVADRLTATDVAALIGAGRHAEEFSDDSLGETQGCGKTDRIISMGSRSKPFGYTPCRRTFAPF